MTRPVRLAAVLGDADALDEIRDEIDIKDVAEAVGVARHEIAGGGLEDEIAAVVIERRREAVAVAFFAAEIDAGTADHPGVPVEDEDVAGLVEIIRHEIGGD